MHSDYGESSPAKQLAAEATPAHSPQRQPVQTAHEANATTKSIPPTKTYEEERDVDSSPLLDVDDESDFDEDVNVKRIGTRSPSEASSPVRQMTRKSSLNFASLPAREPLPAGKATSGGRTSRLSYTKPPQYPRLASERNNTARYDIEQTEEIQDDDDVFRNAVESPDPSKTYTQRLQDQIKRLGHSDGNSAPPPPLAQSPPHTVSKTFAGTKIVSPQRKESIQQTMQTTPGAFPEDDDDDDWIEPPTTVRPGLPKSYSADVMEGIRDKDTIGQPDFSRGNGPEENFTQGILATPGAAPASPVVSRIPTTYSETALTQISSTSEMALRDTLKTVEARPESPSRPARESPLKQIKNKVSSILKSSRGLLASSAAISAESKAILSPSTLRLGLHPMPSVESISSPQRGASKTLRNADLPAPASPTRPTTRPAYATMEQSRLEMNREAEAKAKAADQLAKLEHAREQEREKARVFSKEQERIAAMENEIVQKKQIERKALPSQTPKANRSSPRKPRLGDDSDAQDGDLAMTDAPLPVPPSAAKAASTTGHALRNKESKRPVKPTREPLVKAKLVPTVIRVNTGSQHSQYRPSSRQSTGQPDAAPTPVTTQPPQLASKASKAALQAKSSTQSLRSLSAAKKKEQEEREAQRKREAKAEADRKKAAAQEEARRQEQQRRAELERQKQKERELAEEKKHAQRQAAIEKAKLTRAPPPAVRGQPNGPPDLSAHQQKSVLASAQKPSHHASRPPSRMGPADNGTGRLAGSVVSSLAAGHKRVLETNDKDAKRRRTSENFDDSESSNQHMKGPPVRPSPGLKKVFIRPDCMGIHHANKAQDMPKGIFQSGYSNAPASVTRDIFKASVASQQGVQKGGHPLDMAQISKGGIPFAPNQNGAGSAFKTPARTGHALLAKSTTKSVSRPSPQYQNGESIELPEIETDDEEDDDPGMQVAPWANSPALHQALVSQETLDPSQIFGAPGPLNMEEVFSKNKERWQKFRARTSSANWSGLDRLTEDDVRKDMAAREKLRREGGWSYEMSRDML